MRQSTGPLFLLVCVILSCRFGRSTEYFPLSPSGQWEYSVDYTGSFGNPQKGKVVARTEGTQVINGKTYYKIVTISSGMPGVQDSTSLYRRDSDGIYVLDGTTERLYLPSSLDIGRTWTLNEANREWTFRVEGIETAHLIAKKYEDCVKISFELVQTTETTFGPATDRMSGVTYRAPGIGEVKMSIQGQHGKAEFSLDSYTQ